jgi:hypothetical protein
MLLLRGVAAYESKQHRCRLASEHLLQVVVVVVVV